MHPIYQFLITPKQGRIFDNVKRIGGVDFVTSTDEHDYKATNRFAEVLRTPKHYKGEISAGDIVVVHHNTFRHRYDMNGKYLVSAFHVKDNVFFVEANEFYMYKKPNQEWKAHDRFCFVRPMPAQSSVLSSIIKEQPLHGIMEYPNEYLLKCGVKKGDIVVFTPDSDYEFKVEGQKLYRVYDHQITSKLN